MKSQPFSNPVFHSPGRGSLVNVYAHIWRNLRKQELNETAVIATRLPDALDAAYTNRNRNPSAFENEIAQWDPIISIPFDNQHVQDTVQAFASTVDRIEDGAYSPPPVSDLYRSS
jgi:hypothetical protein